MTLKLSLMFNKEFYILSFPGPMYFPWLLVHSITIPVARYTGYWLAGLHTWTAGLSISFNFMV